MTILRKVFATVGVIVLMLAMAVVPCFAASSFTWSDGSFPDGTFGSTFEYIYITLGNGDIYIAGNSYYDTYVYTTEDEFFGDAPFADYSVVNYSDKETYAYLRNWSGNWAQDDFTPFLYEHLSSSVFQNVNNQLPQGSYFESVAGSLVPRWYDTSSNEQLPFIMFNTVSQYTNIEASITFEIYEVVDDKWTLVPYTYTGSVLGADIPINNRATTREFVNSRYDQFLQDTGYLGDYVRISHSAKFTATLQPTVYNGFAVTMWCAGDAYALDEDDVTLPVDYSTVIEQVDIFGWITRGVDRFLNLELLPGVSFATLLLLAIALPVLIAALRLLGGVG